MAEEDDPSKGLACPEGQVVAKVTFGSYGTPSGRCGSGGGGSSGDAKHSFKRGGCHAAGSQKALESRCVGQAHCALVAANHAFAGDDPCLGTRKRVAVAVSCGPKSQVPN